MTTEKTEKKVLAIAARRDGKVIGKYLPGKKPICLGFGYDSDIIVEEDSGLPESLVLISKSETPDEWELKLTDGMQCVITSGDGSKLNFEDMKDFGIFPVASDGCYMLTFKYGDTAEIHAGTTEVKIGFVPPPAKAKKVMPKIKQSKKAESVEPSKNTDFVLKLVITDSSGERELFPKAGLMTVGQADYNTVCCTSCKKLPRIHTLLEPVDDRYKLTLIPSIKGGIYIKGKKIEFSTFIKRNLMQKDPSVEGQYSWIFVKNITGVFDIGDTNISFSFVEPPAVVEKKPEPVEIPKVKQIVPEYNWEDFGTRPHESIAMKGNRQESDRIVLILGIAITAALIFGTVFDKIITVTVASKEEVLRSAPSERVSALLQTETSTSNTSIGEEVVSDMGPGEEVAGGGAGESSGGSSGSEIGQAGATAGQQVLSDIGFAAYGTGGGSGGAGVAVGLQEAASSGAGLSTGSGGETIIAGSQGGGGSGGLSGLTGAGSGGVSTSIEGISSSDIEQVHTEAEVSFSASTSSSVDLGVQGRTMSAIRAKINTIKYSVKSAYENLLRSNPTAGGTISISFSITPSGSVTGVSVSVPSSMSAIRGQVESVVNNLNFGASSEQTTNIPMTVPFSMVPPE